jgi:hypothetical protein
MIGQTSWEGDVLGWDMLLTVIGQTSWEGDVLEWDDALQAGGN